MIPDINFASWECWAGTLAIGLVITAIITYFKARAEKLKLEKLHTQDNNSK